MLKDYCGTCGREVIMSPYQGNCMRPECQTPADTKFQQRIMEGLKPGLSRARLFVHTNNPEEVIYHYGLTDTLDTVASVGYIYHTGFKELRWEILYNSGKMVVVGSLEEAEAKLSAEFGAIHDIGDAPQ